LLELTDDIRFLLPILLAIAVAKNVSDALIGPLYDELIELKSMPFVHAVSHSPEVDMLPITDIMTRDVVTFTEVERIGKIFDVRKFRVGKF
jgi:chloride channel 7